ncbi:unnamed protein product, partial [Polarella glacialis]
TASVATSQTSETRSVGSELPAWVQPDAKLRWWSESQKRHNTVSVTKIDDKKKVVIVTFASDKSVWKSVPFSKIGRKDCPLQNAETPSSIGDAKPKAQADSASKESDEEKPNEDGTSTPDWWKQEKSKLLDKT